MLGKRVDGQKRFIIIHYAIAKLKKISQFTHEVVEGFQAVPDTAVSLPFVAAVKLVEISQ